MKTFWNKSKMSNNNTVTFKIKSYTEYTDKFPANSLFSQNTIL